MVLQLWLEEPENLPQAQPSRESTHGDKNSISSAVTDKQTVNTLTTESRPPANLTYKYMSLTPVTYGTFRFCPAMSIDGRAD